MIQFAFQKKVWKLHCRLLAFLLIFAFLVPCVYSYEANVVNDIDAARNAKEHNNQGVAFLRDKDYYAAIKEFEIAIGINPNTQATSVYYNNLGHTYMKIYELTKNVTLAKLAQNCFEKAVLQDCMNITYYKNLVDSYEAQGILNQKLSFLLANRAKNPYNLVIAGLIYIKQNKIGIAVTTLDDFCSQNPDLVITKDLQRIIDSYNVFNL